jgi:uncharacterized protein involved in response to NO
MTPSPEPVRTFHALVLVQGFLLCFALGFLYTFIPRRTGTSGPSVVQLGASLVLPVLLTASAWVEAWLWSQLLFLGQLVVLLGFVVPRVLLPAEGRGVPEGMVWVPVAVGTGAAGAPGCGWAARRAPSWWPRGCGWCSSGRWRAASPRPTEGP